MDWYKQGIQQMLADQRAQQAALQRRRQEASNFALDPGAADTYAASIMTHLSPTGTPPRKGKFTSATEAVDNEIPSGHPFKGFGTELRNRLQDVMTHPATLQAGADPREIAQALTQKMLAEPGRSGAISRLEEAREYKRKADVKWFNLTGPDESVRKPLGADYDRWLEWIRKAETPEARAAVLRAQGLNKEADEILAAASPIATLKSTLLMGALGAAGFGLTAKNPWAVPAGFLAGVFGEVFGKPISKKVTASEWYNAKVGPLTVTRTPMNLFVAGASAGAGGVTGRIFGRKVGMIAGGIAGLASSTDTGKAFLAEVAPYFVAGLSAEKAIMKTFAAPRAVHKTLMKDPSGKNLADGGRLMEQRKVWLNDEKVVGKFVNDFLNPEYVPSLNSEAINAFKDITKTVTGRKKVEQAVSKRLKDLLAQDDYRFMGLETADKFNKAARQGVSIALKDSSVMEEAIKHPKGFIHGAIEATARKRAKTFTDPAVGDRFSKIVDTRGAKEAATANQTAKQAQIIPARLIKEGAVDVSDALGRQVDQVHGRAHTPLTPQPTREWNFFKFHTQKDVETHVYWAGKTGSSVGSTLDDAVGAGRPSITTARGTDPAIAEHLKAQGRNVEELKEAERLRRGKPAVKPLSGYPEKPEQRIGDVTEELGKRVQGAHRRVSAEPQLYDSPTGQVYKAPVPGAPREPERLMPTVSPVDQKRHKATPVSQEVTQLLRKNTLAAAKEQRIVTDTAEAIIDQVHAGSKATQQVARDRVKRLLSDYDSDPVARKVLETASKPTDIGSKFSAGNTPSMPPKIATKAVSDDVTSIPDFPTVKGVDWSDVRGVGKEDLVTVPKEAKKRIKQPDTPKGVATEKEAVELGGDALLSPKDIGKITTVGQSKHEVIDTVIGPQKISYAPSKGVTIEQAREVAVKQTQTLAKQKQAEIDYIQEMRAIQKLDPDDVDNLIRDYGEMHRTGQIGTEELLHRVYQATDAMSDPKLFATQESLGAWQRKWDPLVSHLRQMVANKTFMAAFGVPAAVFSFFAGGDEAHAGYIDQMAKGAYRGLQRTKKPEAALTGLVQKFKDAKYITGTAVPDDKFLLKADEFQRGLQSTRDFGSWQIIKDIDGWAKFARKEGRIPLLHRIMTPGVLLDMLTDTGKYKMNNPAIFKVSYQASEYNNILKGNKVVDNILRDSGIVSARKEVERMFAPLTDDMFEMVRFEYATDQMKHLPKEINKLRLNKKKLPQDVVDDLVESTASKMREHQETIENLKGFIPKYHKKWAEVAEEAAEKYSSVRTFLAVGDDAKFTKYPFLKNLNFTDDELIAVGRVKEQLQQYKHRIAALGEEVMEGPYAPHVFHPQFNTRRFAEIAGGSNEGRAFMRLYHRSPHSRPLVPDLEASMRRYIGDTERRIHSISFWERDGWNLVADRAAHIPSINHAFRSLKEGMEPIDYTYSNRFAQRYTEFETVKRLFLSPSATLKHFIKINMDIAQRGLAEVVEAAPMTAKMMKNRMLDINPEVRQWATKMGIGSKNDQDRLFLDFFKSLVPAHGTRRFMLDLGLNPHEEVFARAGSFWHKFQDFSGSGIAFAELSDRALSIFLGAQIGAKRGLTMETALYGVSDMLLKNNFLFREFNPAWLRNPVVKMMTMFQATPFKILEKRAVNFIRSGRIIKDLGKDIYKLTRQDYARGNYANTKKILMDLRNIRRDVKMGEDIMQSNIFLDAALRHTDFFGSSIINNFAKDMLIIGAATYMGAEAGMHLKAHFFHLPFLKPGMSQPTPSLMPLSNAFFDALQAHRNRQEGDDDFLHTKVIQRWLGSGWYALVPDTVKKAHRISIDEIPEIYRDSPYKYMFAIPTKEKD